jgi:DNA polymerase-3 subunit gamma/tau
MPADETQLLYSMCLHGRGELGLAPDEYAALTMVLLRLLAFKPANGSTAQAEKKTLKVTRPPEPSATPKPITSDALPAGQRLPLVSMVPTPTVAREPAQVFEKNSSAALSEQGLGATHIEAVQVRVQADSPRDRAVAAAVPHAVQPGAEGDFWHATVQTLIANEAITAMVRELALQSQLVARDTDQWLLRVERESLNQSGSRERLAARWPPRGTRCGWWPRWAG